MNHDQMRRLPLPPEPEDRSPFVLDAYVMECRALGAPVEMIARDLRVSVRSVQDRLGRIDRAGGRRLRAANLRWSVTGQRLGSGT